MSLGLVVGEYITGAADPRRHGGYRYKYIR